MRPLRSLFCNLFGKDQATAGSDRQPDTAEDSQAGLRTDVIPSSAARALEADRSFRRMILSLRGLTWLQPVFGAIALTIVGTAILWVVQTNLEDSVRSQLQTVLTMEASMLREWARQQVLNADMLRDDTVLRPELIRLLRLSEEQETGSLTSDSADGIESRDRFTSRLADYGYCGFFVVNHEWKIVAGSNADLTGQDLHEDHRPHVERSLHGQTVVSPPSDKGLAANTSADPLTGRLPTMFVSTSLRATDQQVVGVLGLLIDPDRDFERILSGGKIGRTGDTYAFSEHGLMLSRSRFERELILIGMLPEHENSTTAHCLEVRDPGQDTRVHGRPRSLLAGLPLTEMARSATLGNFGVRTEPYRDYRGALVAGAWTWIPELQIGVATEIEQAEAFSVLSILRNAIRFSVGILATAAVVMFIQTWVTERRLRIQRESGADPTEVGPYRLEGRLGAGAMGVVFKASHSMMLRTSAVKLLNHDRSDESALQRFEREVQAACQLTHPNTIAVYDYGRTSDGVFYYAMEYLDGIDLQQLVEKYGPQSEGRVIHILKQVCGALFEAHSRGLVHRDIKPSNIMINLRGGEADVVKVLDFGLVKAIPDEHDPSSVMPESIDGTALYLSPEAIQAPASVDARSDIYALGAVGYFLLTGQTVFSAASLPTLLQKHISSMPLPPSVCLGKPVSEQLESALLACLSKNPGARPDSTRTLADLLSQVPTAQAWTRDEAERWWNRIQRGLSPRKPRIGRSVTCKFEQTMVNVEEALSWADESDEQHPAQHYPEMPTDIMSWNLRDQSS